MKMVKYKKQKINNIQKIINNIMKECKILIKNILQI